MKKFIKHPITVLVMLVIGTVIAGIIFMKTCTHEVTYKGTVMSHHTASDKYGDIEYYTIAIFNDGCIRSLKGLKYYVVKEGNIIYYTTNVIN